MYLLMTVVDSVFNNTVVDCVLVNYSKLPCIC